MKGRLMRAIGTGCCAGVVTGFLLVLMGGLLGGIYTMMYAVFLCPMISVSAGLFGFVWSMTR